MARLVLEHVLRNFFYDIRRRVVKFGIVSIILVIFTRRHEILSKFYFNYIVKLFHLHKWT